MDFVSFCLNPREKKTQTTASYFSVGKQRVQFLYLLQEKKPKLLRMAFAVPFVTVSGGFFKHLKSWR